MKTDQMNISVPSIYADGYDKARRTDPGLAANYMKYTTVDDPVADAAVAALAPFDQARVHRLIQAGMDADAPAFREAPQPLQDFFDEIETPPAWFDPEATYAGCRAFHQYSDLFIPAFFVVTLQNAATLISKAFYLTGRVTTEHGLRRIRQNTRHFIEIMLPGSLSRDGEGWKLSVRIRLVHAQVRRQIRALADEWDESVYGAPLSSAHMALASANFSATMLRQAMKLGAELDAEARVGFMQTWRYASWLIGSPEELLFEGDEEKTAELYRVASVCEPPPSEEAAVIGNSLINALPDIAGLDKATARRAMTIHVQRVSRALLGKELADQLRFPRRFTGGLLRWLRWKRRIHQATQAQFPRLAQKWRGEHFSFLLDASVLDDLSYRLPDQLRADLAKPW